MGICRLSALLSLIGGVLFILPHCLGKNVPIRLQSGDNSSLSEGKGEGRPRVTRSEVACDSGFDEFCMNNGKCMFLVDLNERHCQCDIGFSGPRCINPDMVRQKMAGEEIVLIVFCVGLLLIGLAGALYFFFKWYKKNKFPRQQKRQGYRGVQLV
ncbi:proepiregulin [Oryzias melastigma]|uniref:Proepiregulin-like n=1 Tax=Oryzias melastigma TaxID=30732 RepID=A0A3B3CAT9_ORYME|nr:proepiregulin [Oryzias melastigma]